MIDDQPITPMPKRCTVWPCKGRVRPSGGFHKCDTCGVSYGPAARKARRRHSACGQVRCPICEPLRCVKAGR